MKTMTLFGLAALLSAAVMAADLQSLQVARRQAEIQLTLAQQQLASAQRALDADLRALKEKTDAESKMHFLGYDHIGARKYRKGTGDPSAQTAINGLQMKVMTSSQAVAKQEALVGQWQKYVAGLDAQIAALDPTWKPGRPAAVATAAPAAAAGEGMLRGRIIAKGVQAYLQGMRLPKPGVYVDVNGERIFLPHYETAANVGEMIEVTASEKGRTQMGDRWFQTGPAQGSAR